MPWGVSPWGIAPESGREALDASLGIDIFFNGRYEMTAAGKLAVVSGVAALSQGLYHRIITKPGSYAYRPSYGVGIQRWAKSRNTVSDMHELEQVVKDQLSFDRRVSRVSQVLVSPIPNAPGIYLGFDIEAFGTPITFRPLAFPREGVTSA